MDREPKEPVCAITPNLIGVTNREVFISEVVIPPLASGADVVVVDENFSVNLNCEDLIRSESLSKST